MFIIFPSMEMICADLQMVASSDYVTLLNTVHSFIQAISIAPLQVLYRPRLLHGYCIRVSRRSAQATACKGLAQGPYVTARAGVEPTTLWLKVIDSTKAPSRPTSSSNAVT